MALGHAASGTMSNDDAFVERFLDVVALCGERYWRMPLYADYDGMMDSEVADLKNTSVAWAGATMAAIFLREFVEGRPWVHLDIAGSAWHDDGALKAIPQGPTGSGVRLMAHLAVLLAGG